LWTSAGYPLVICVFLTGLRRLVRRPWLLLLSLVLLAGGLVGSRHLWAWYHYRAGRAALEAYHNDEARAHLDQCLRVWSTSIPAHVLAARAARRAEAFPEAEQLLNACERPSPKAADAVTLEWSRLQATMGNLVPVGECLVA